MSPESSCQLVPYEVVVPAAGGEPLTGCVYFIIPLPPVVMIIMSVRLPSFLLCFHLPVYPLQLWEADPSPASP